MALSEDSSWGGVFYQPLSFKWLLRQMRAMVFGPTLDLSCFSGPPPNGGSGTFDRRGARARARKLAPLLVLSRQLTPWDLLHFLIEE